MAAFVPYNCFVFHLGKGYHQLGTHKVTVALTNTAPDAANHVWLADANQITAANGYNNTNTCDCNWVQAANVTKLSANNDVTWTASGNFGPFRYPFIYNANATDGANNTGALIGYWDYSSSINCNNGESFTVDFPANKLVLQLTNA